MKPIITLGSQVPISENIITGAGSQYDRRSYTRTWWIGESELFMTEANTEGQVRINCAEARKPKEESNSMTKATWFIQPFDWMTCGTFKFDQVRLGTFNIDDVAKKFDIIDLEQLEWDDVAKSDFTLCKKWKVSDPNIVVWEADNKENPSKYRTHVTLTFLEREGGEIVDKRDWTVTSEWVHGNSLEVVQGPIINTMRAHFREYYRGMTIKSTD